MKNLMILIFLFTLSELPAEAQFLNRLKKSIQRGAEEAVLDKAEEESYNQTDKALDKMFENSMKKYSVDSNRLFIAKEELPPKYDFDWNYQLTMNSQDSGMVMDFYLSEDGNYFGSSSEQMSEMKMVIDSEQKAMVMYMENDGEKMAMAMKMPEKRPNYEDTVFDDSFTFKKTGNTKKIMGYHCEEFTGENPEYKFVTYITQEAKVDFGDFYKMDRKRLPVGFDPDWLKDGKGLMMEMEMIEKNKKKNKITTIVCTRLEPFNFTLNNGEYQFMQY